MEVVSAGLKADTGRTEPTSEIVTSGDEAQVEATAELRAHLGQMLNDPAYSDVAFVCNDGKRVLASRILLAGRSDVLKGMLMSGMAESNLSQISLLETSSPVLLSVFEFLYTGTLLKYHPQSWRMACEIVAASRFFLLPKLEKIARKIMHTFISGVAQNLPKAASFLTEALEYKSLCEEIDVNLEELVRILSSNWSDPVFVRSLSKEAFQYLLRKSKGSFDEDDKHTFTEYLRFRQVIRWCVSKSDDETKEELLNSIAPDEHQALSLVHRGKRRKVDSLLKDASLSCDSSPVKNDEKIRNLAIELSSNIDYRKIHPVLLATVVEPLNIIPATEILDSLRFHALHRAMIFENPEYGWDHGISYSTPDRGFRIEKAHQGIGLAVLKAAMWSSYAIYQWIFNVGEEPETFCELGFIDYGSGVGIEKPDLQGKRLSEHNCARVVDFRFLDFDDGVEILANRGGAAGHNRCERLLSSGTYKTTARFTFDTRRRTCSLSFDDEDVGVVWRNLPKAVYCPAVSLGTSSTGSVSIELITGFDIL